MAAGEGGSLAAQVKGCAARSASIRMSQSRLTVKGLCHPCSPCLALVPSCCYDLLNRCVGADVIGNRGVQWTSNGRLLIPSSRASPSESAPCPALPLMRASQALSHKVLYLPKHVRCSPAFKQLAYGTLKIMREAAHQLNTFVETARCTTVATYESSKMKYYTL